LQGSRTVFDDYKYGSLALHLVQQLTSWSSLDNVRRLANTTLVDLSLNPSP